MEKIGFDLVYSAFKSDIHSALEPEFNLARRLWGCSNKKLIFYGLRSPKTLADLCKKATISIIQNNAETTVLEDVNMNLPFLFLLDTDGLYAMGYSMPPT